MRRVRANIWVAINAADKTAVDIQVARYPELAFAGSGSQSA
jgi:hypothetical protein